MKDQSKHRALDDILKEVATREIIGALQRAHGHRTLAAKMLGMTRSKFYRRMNALGIDPRKAHAGTN